MSEEENMKEYSWLSVSLGMYLKFNQPGLEILGTKIFGKFQKVKFEFAVHRQQFI